MLKLKLAACAAAEGLWSAVRAAGRAALGRERFDGLVGKTGLRGLKNRLWLSRQALPDGVELLHRPQDRCIVSEVYEGSYDDAAIGENQVVVDVGAHIGAFALRAGLRVGPRGRVLAFEPSPATFELLLRNVRLNGLGWVEAHPVAVADAEGTAELFLSDDEDGNPAADSLRASEGRRTVLVNLRRLDDVLAEEGVICVDFLKIDVEGAELRVLEGAARTLRATRRVAMEVHPPRVDPAEARRRLEAAGFSVRAAPSASGAVILLAERSGIK